MGLYVHHHRGRNRPANPVVWPTLFEKRWQVGHLVAHQLFDLSGDLDLADRDEAFRLPAGRGDAFA